jgi:putative ABC transport system substrate-binding protein
MGVQLKTLDMRSAEDVEPVLAEALAWQAQAIINFGSPGPATDAFLRIVDFAAQNRIPLAAGNIAVVQAGGLLSYGASYNGMGRTATAFVGKVITGTSPADLPVEQPTVFDLVINQTTAQALGITIPPEVAQQVTQWVQ